MAEKERIGATIARTLKIVGAWFVGGVQVTATAAEMNVLHGATATTAELNVLHGVTAGTTSASKALVVDASKALDTLTVAGSGLVLGTSTLAKKVAKVALVGTTIHAGPVAWQNPEAGAIVINRITIDGTTVATAAGTIEAGTTATSAVTASANLIDTLDVHTATGTFDNLANPGSAGKMLQKLAAGKWVTFAQASGDLSGFVGSAYIEYAIL